MRHWNNKNAIIILGCGFLYITHTCLNISLSILFVRIYNLNQVEADLIYLPFGVGGVVSTFISGTLLDRAWRNTKINRGLSTDKAVGDDLDNFPVEKARLCVIWTPMIVVTTCSVTAFGWVLYYRKVYDFTYVKMAES